MNDSVGGFLLDSLFFFCFFFLSSDLTWGWFGWVGCFGFGPLFSFFFWLLNGGEVVV